MTDLDLRLLSHRWAHTLQSAALLAALGAQAALLGALAGGGLGALAAGLLAAAALFAAANASPRFTLRALKARPLARHQAPAVHAAVDAFSDRAGLVVKPSLFWIPSSTPNAVAVGSTRRPAIALTQGLVQQLSPRELNGVIAHELAHIHNGDLSVMAVADSLARFTRFLGQFGGMLALLGLFTLQSSWMVVGVLLTMGPGLSTLLMLALSRQREHAADTQAIALTRDPAGLASALASIERRGGTWARLRGLDRAIPSALRSHPHTEERIARLRSLAQPGPAWV